MQGDVYTLAVWKVKPGEEESFIAAWNELGDFFLGLPKPPGQGTLVRSLEDATLFFSFGPWDSLDDIQAMRAHPQTSAMIGKLTSLCDDAKPGSFRVVATAP